MLSLYFQGLGSNISLRIKNKQRNKKKLEKRPQVSKLAVSPFINTEREK